MLVIKFDLADPPQSKVIRFIKSSSNAMHIHVHQSIPLQKHDGPIHLSLKYAGRACMYTIIEFINFIQVQVVLTIIVY